MNMAFNICKILVIKQLCIHIIAIIVICTDRNIVCVIIVDYVFAITIYVVNVVGAVVAILVVYDC